MTREEKRIREELGTAVDKMQDITAKADKEDRELTNKEKKQHSRLYDKVKNLKKELEGEMALNGNFDNSGAIAVNNMYGDRHQGGQSLDSEGKVKAYAANQSIAADADDDVDISLGEYLRAVVDKPRTEKQRTAIQNSVTSGDYELPTRVAGELIDKLRAQNPLLMEGGAGARTVSIEGGDTKFISIDSFPNSTWHAEMVEETPSDPGFDSVTMAPKTVLSMTEIGRETLQDAANVEEALESAFVGSLNDAITTATFTGSGSNTPTGLATTISQTETYTNGGSPDWSNFVNASKTLYDNNIPDDNRSFIYAPDVWQTLALIQDSNNRYQDAPSAIRDIPDFTTSGLTAGQSYVGDFSNVVYGFRLDITLEQFPAEAAKKYGSLWVAAARLDIATFRPNALVRIEEAAA